MQKYTTMTIDGQKEFNNLLEGLLDQKFNRINDKTSFYHSDFKHYRPREATLSEFRTLWMLSPRQTGTTQQIAATFDITSDIYVAHKLSMAENFKERFVAITGTVFPMMYTALRAGRFVPHSPHKLSNVKRVFIDIGGPFLMDHLELLRLVKAKIAYFETILNDDVVYIIT